LEVSRRPMFTGLSARSWSLSPARGESAPFSSLPEASRASVTAFTRAALARRAGLTRTVRPPEPHDPGKHQTTKTPCQISGCVHYRLAYDPGGSRVPRPSETGQFSSFLVLGVGRGGELWSWKSQEGQNAQVSTNCPLLQIPAQSRLGSAQEFVEVPNWRGFGRLLILAMGRSGRGCIVARRRVPNLSPPGSTEREWRWCSDRVRRSVDSPHLIDKKWIVDATDGLTLGEIPGRSQPPDPTTSNEGPPRSDPPGWGNPKRRRSISRIPIPIGDRTRRQRPQARKH
jgi:hypothetical protein